MTHLTPQELLDIAEGARPAEAFPHLRACGVCRGQLVELRDAMVIAAVDVPEPSPLFWDHFSTRVREAIAAEPVPARTWLGRQLWTWKLAVAMSTAIVVVAVAVTLRMPTAPATSSPPSEPVAIDVGSTALGDDPSFALLGDLAGGLDWDTAEQAGITTDVGSAEKVVAELNGAERTELQRLLREAMAGSGA